MRTIYRVRTCGHSMGSRTIPMEGEIPNGWYDSQEIAAVEFNKHQENRINEYNELLPQAMKILEQKEMKLMATIANLGCDVFTSAEAQDDTGIDSWLTIEICLTGKFGSYSYLSKIDI